MTKKEIISELAERTGLALCEVKRWLEGVKAKIEGTIQSIDNKEAEQ